MRTALRLIRPLAVAAVLLVPAAAFAQSDACVDVNLEAGSQEVCAGSLLNVTASLTNCGATTDKIILDIVATGVDGLRVVIPNVRAGASREISYPLAIPSAAPRGLFNVTVTATTKKGAPEDVASLSVNVLDCSGGG